MILTALFSLHGRTSRAADADAEVGDTQVTGRLEWVTPESGVLELGRRTGHEPDHGSYPPGPAHRTPHEGSRAPPAPRRGGWGGGEARAGAPARGAVDHGDEA